MRRAEKQVKEGFHIMNENKGFPHGHETLKVTMVLEGHPQAIDEALHGAHEAQSKAWQSRDLERSQKWEAEDAKYNAQEALRQANLFRDEDKQRFSAQIAKLQAALQALTSGEVQIQDVVAFLATRQASVNINEPVRSNVYLRDSDPYYPMGLLVGDRASVKQQILACFVDDAERKNKIQAIKTLRERSGLGLKEAKECVEWALGTHFTNR
jgi:hypothetical protein